MKIYLFVPVILALYSLQSFCQTETDSRVRPFGHNVSATSYTLDQGQCTIGLVQVVGCGVSDRITIGTSPWLDYSYNMYSAFIRARVGESTDVSQDAAQFAYLKTYNQGFGSYELEMAWLTYVRTYFLAPHHTIHLNAQLMYYFDDAFPFSLRRPWSDRSPMQVNVSALNEIRLVNGWYVNAEIGFLGATQNNPDLLLALTFEYRTVHWQFHGGFSQTATLTGYRATTERYDVQQLLRKYQVSYKDYRDNGSVQYDYAIHPEFSLQYYF